METTTTNTEQAHYLDIFRETTVGRYLSKHEDAFINPYLDRAKHPCSLLDIACGSGYFTLPLHDKAFQVVGIDLDDEALAVLRQKSSTVSLGLANAERMPFGNKSFDYILAIQCFEFLDSALFLDECHRILANDGLLIFDFLNRKSYKWLLKRMTGRTDYLQHPSAGLSHLDVFTALETSGFHIENAIGYNWQPFTRNSNSTLVEIAASIEDMLHLEQFYQISPKILVAARKVA